MGVFYYINIHMEKTINIDSIASALSTRKTIISSLRTKIESLDKILTQIESYRVPVKAVFFSKSIAFRVGSSSIQHGRHQFIEAGQRLHRVQSPFWWQAV